MIPRAGGKRFWQNIFSTLVTLCRGGGGSHEVKAFLAATFSYNDSVIAANWKIYYGQYPGCHAGPIIDNIHTVRIRRILFQSTFASDKRIHLILSVLQHYVCQLVADVGPLRFKPVGVMTHASTLQTCNRAGRNWGMSDLCVFFLRKTSYGLYTNFTQCVSKLMFTVLWNFKGNSCPNVLRKPYYSNVNGGRELTSVELKRRACVIMWRRYRLLQDIVGSCSHFKQSTSIFHYSVEYVMTTSYYRITSE